MGFFNPALMILNVGDLFLAGLLIRMHSFNNDEDIKSVRVTVFVRRCYEFFMWMDFI